MIAYLVPHTHWDREWYHGVGRFRQRLVALVDELLDRPPDDALPFLLDGQAVVLDDYLAVRPERRGELAAALQDGRIEAGPWYVLADELIPGGESLVRNLLAGRRALRRLGADAPPVLYSPDAFGHAAALPSIARGFGLDVAIVWRGYGGRRWPDGDAAAWRGPDGATVTLFHLPPSGYEVGSSLPTDDAGARARWRALRDALVPRARLGLVIVQNGADHHALQRGARAAYGALARAARREATVRPAGMREVAVAIARRGAATTLPTVEGELRDSYGYAWTLQGTFATRAHQKRAAARVERLLVRDAEPWAALSGLGASAGARDALHAAWATLLRCHPHDTLCGCSTDGVARAMDARLASAAEQGRGLRDDALLAAIGHDPVEARTRGHGAWTPVLVARNAAPRPRGGVAEVELLTFAAHEAVGPGSAADGAPPAVPPRWCAAGLHVQPLDDRVVRDRTESPRHYPDNDLVLRTRAVAWLPPVAAYGTRAFALGDGAVEVAPAAERVRAASRSLDNGRLRVRVDARGRVELRTADGTVLRDAIGFESVGDAGDTYTHSPIGAVRVGAPFVGARLLARGPLRAALELRFALRLPRSRTRAGASARTVAIPLRVRLTLDAGADFLRVAVRGVNRARDHRLRLVLRTGVRDAIVHADAAFGPVRRAPLDVPQDDQREERTVPTAPLHRHVTVSNADRGVTVFGDGLAEYEATPDGAVCATLVRAVGALSRNDLPERRGHAGWPVDTPGAQCAGPFAGAFAILPHGPRDDRTIALVERTADDVLLPLRATTLRSALRLPAPAAGAELHGDGLAMSAIKPAEDGDGVVLRCVNLLDVPVRGAWTLGSPFETAARARLDETPLGGLSAAGGRVDFEAGPREIVTIRVRSTAG